MKSLLGFILTLLLAFGLAMPSGNVVRANARSPRALPFVHEHAACEFLSATDSAALITWHPVEVECPVCKTRNIFMQWGSYGSYIYQYPSKYQLVFWPQTDGAAWWSCKRCRLTAFMGDFKSIPAEKIPALREALRDAKLPPQKERSAAQSMDEPPYLALPKSARLVVAEKVYRTLGQMKDEGWNHFYRVMGYHFQLEGMQAEADEARRKSLALTKNALAADAADGVRKELLYVSGAMKHFLRDDAGALRDFEEARKLTYSNKEIKGDNGEGYNAYLSNLIDEYIEMLRKGDGPRNKDANDN
ncbi:MAG TPA: hypothetical protein VJT09_02690 [Pyrinomonadaceae bacterium]|nr:hypothetical protein [Pyrinomonadaceae bacterium]